jgi:hypothetical protein
MFELWIHGLKQLKVISEPEEDSNEEQPKLQESSQVRSSRDTPVSIAGNFRILQLSVQADRDYQKIKN